MRRERKRGQQAEKEERARMVDGFKEYKILKHLLNPSAQQHLSNYLATVTRHGRPVKLQFSLHVEGVNIDNKSDTLYLKFRGWCLFKFPKSKYKKLIKQCLCLCCTTVKMCSKSAYYLLLSFASEANDHTVQTTIIQETYKKTCTMWCFSASPGAWSSLVLPFIATIIRENYTPATQAAVTRNDIRFTKKRYPWAF